ncbi:hypothetical protein J4439_02815 [Candidatus Woesearchaeota archaeon]|nr:hypothetical protein [Candidatus Woesearchaeota archaeon]
MTVSITVVLGFGQIILQIAAAYFSYSIYRFNRLGKGWLLVTAAVIIMTLRRLTALGLEMKLLTASGTFQFIDRFVLPSSISVFLLLGLLSMYRNFESFDVVERKTGEKIKLLAKARKK